QPDGRLGQLEIVSPREREYLLVTLNQTRGDYSTDHCLHQMFESRAAACPERVAVVFEDQHLSYAALDARAEESALELRRQGAGAEVVVGLCVERSLEMVVGMLGILKAGGAYLPLDPSYPRERLAYMLEDSQAELLLIQRSVAEKLPSHEGRVLYLDRPLGCEPGTGMAERAPASAQNLAYVIYTSGSSGRPKGVMIPHEAIVNRLPWIIHQLPLREEDAVLQKTALSFDASVWELFAPLLSGARLVVARPGGHQDSRYLVRTLQAEQVTVLQVVPSMLGALLEDPELVRCRS